MYAFKEMYEDYYAIRLSVADTSSLDLSTLAIHSLPLLLPDYIPSDMFLPSFLYQLGTTVCDSLEGRSVGQL